MRTERVIDLFNNFRLRLAEHQSQLRIAWGIITRTTVEIKQQTGGGVVSRELPGLCSIYIPFTFVYGKDVEVYRSVYLCPFGCRW